MHRCYRPYLLQMITVLSAIILIGGSFAVVPKLLPYGLCNSSTVVMNQFENLARKKNYTLEPLPNYTLCTDSEDAMQLTDGVYTSGFFWTQLSTVGWQKVRPITITIDLGKVEPIRGVSFNTAAGRGGVVWPASISVLVSDNGKDYYPACDLVALSNQHSQPPAQGYAVHRYWTDALKTHGRYVQVIIDTVENYCFTDEIEVYRGEPEWVLLPMPGEQSIGGSAYLKDQLCTIRMQARLRLDVEGVKNAVMNSGLQVSDTMRLLKELEELKARINHLPPVKADSFRAIMPINDLEAGVFAVQGKVRQLQGRPPLQAWVSHPYDYLTPTQEADINARNKISVSMMKGEWRPAVVNITNLSGASITVKLFIEGLPGGLNPDFISVYQVEWTDTSANEPIAAALIGAKRDARAYQISIPAGMVRQVWFSLYPEGISAGRYLGRIMITSDRTDPLDVPFELNLFPLDFPARPTLHLSGWDYTDGVANDITMFNRQALIQHLQERFVDSPWGRASVFAVGNFDAEGKMSTPPTARFDAWVESWSKARRYCIFVDARESFAGARIGSTEFTIRVKAWIDFWVNHARRKKISPEQLVLLLFDEPRNQLQDEVILTWAKAIRAAQPEVILWENPIHENPQFGLPGMYSVVDVLSLQRSQILEGGPKFEIFYRQKRMEGKRLDLYSASGPMHLLDPYSFARLQAWACWVMGAESTLFWSFSDTGGGNPWQPYTALRRNYAPMFLSSDTVIPGKHMEAMRESVEDYEYFVMLQAAVARRNQDDPAVLQAKALLLNGPRRVLNSPGIHRMQWSDLKDRWEAESVRLEVLAILTKLQ